MEGLPKDVLMETALNLSPSDLISFCATNKKYKETLCDNQTFWRRKLEKDYPEEFYSRESPIENPKELYIQSFTYISRKIENFIDRFIDNVFKGSKKYLNADYKKELFKTIYSVYQSYRDKMEFSYYRAFIDFIPDLGMEKFDEVAISIEDFIESLYNIEKAKKVKREEFKIHVF